MLYQGSLGIENLVQKSNALPYSSFNSRSHAFDFSPSKEIKTLGNFEEPLSTSLEAKNARSLQSATLKNI